jgi:hypothetical protein
VVGQAHRSRVVDHDRHPVGLARHLAQLDGRLEEHHQRRQRGGARSHTNSARRSGVAPRLARHDSAAIAMTARPTRTTGPAAPRRQQHPAVLVELGEPGAARRTVSATIASAASTPSAPKVAHSPRHQPGRPRRRAIAATAIPSTATAAREPAHPRIEQRDGHGDGLAGGVDADGVCAPSSGRQRRRRMMNGTWTWSVL